MFAVVTNGNTHLVKSFKSASRLAARFALAGFDALIVDDTGRTYKPVPKYPHPSRPGSAIARPEAHSRGTVVNGDTGDHRYSRYYWTLPR